MARKPKTSPEAGEETMPNAEVAPIEEAPSAEPEAVEGESAEAAQVEEAPERELGSVSEEIRAEVLGRILEGELSVNEARQMLGLLPIAETPEAVHYPVDDSADFDPKLAYLMGDMRDAMLMRIRNLRKPWQQMGELDQADCANGIELAAKSIIRKTVQLVLNTQWSHASVTLGEVKIKGEKGIEAKISCPNTAEAREVLGEHVGELVMVLMVDSETFFGEREAVRIDKDQPALPLEGTAPKMPPAEEVDPAAEPEDQDPDLSPPAEEDPAPPEEPEEESLGGAPALAEDDPEDQDADDEEAAG